MKVNKKTSKKATVAKMAVKRNGKFRRSPSGPKKDAKGNINLSTTKTPFLVGPKIDKKVYTAADGTIRLKTIHLDGSVEDKVFDILPPDVKDMEVVKNKIFDILPPDVKDMEVVKNKKTPKSRPTVKMRLAGIKKEGTFLVAKNVPIKKGSSKKEWILNNSKSNVLVNRAAKTILSGKANEGCVVVSDYVHSDVFTKEDIETPEFKNLVRRGILEFVNSRQILDLLKDKAATLLESNCDTDQVLARQINSLTSNDIDKILKKSIIKRFDYIDEKTLNRINWLLTQSMRERGELKFGHVVDENGNIVDDKEVKRVVVNLGTSGNVEIPTRRGNLHVSCDPLELNGEDSKLMPNERGEAFSNNNRAINDLSEKLENIKIKNQKIETIDNNFSEQKIEKMINEGINALKNILVKALVSFSK
jgi:hypothetical protein